MGLLDFHSTYKKLLALYLKHSSFWPSADVNPMSNELVHALHWQCMFALYEYTTISMLIKLTGQVHL
jgi:hypothetical protein